MFVEGQLLPHITRNENRQFRHRIFLFSSFASKDRFKKASYLEITSFLALIPHEGLISAILSEAFPTGTSPIAASPVKGQKEQFSSLHFALKFWFHKYLGKPLLHVLEAPEMKTHIFRQN